MRTFRNTADLALETRCNDMLLGRLGRELATVYHDSLDQPLPAALKQLTERLEVRTHVAEQGTHAKGEQG